MGVTNTKLHRFVVQYGGNLREFNIGERVEFKRSITRSGQTYDYGIVNRIIPGPSVIVTLGNTDIRQMVPKTNIKEEESSLATTSLTTTSPQTSTIPTDHEELEKFIYFIKGEVKPYSEDEIYQNFKNLVELSKQNPNHRLAMDKRKFKNVFFDLFLPETFPIEIETNYQFHLPKLSKNLLYKMLKLLVTQDMTTKDILIGGVLTSLWTKILEDPQFFKLLFDQGYINQRYFDLSSLMRLLIITDDINPDLKEQDIQIMKQHGIKSERDLDCQNEKEYIDQENINMIPEEDFIHLSNGACWNIDNLITYIKTQSHGQNDAYAIKRVQPNYPSNKIWDNNNDYYKIIEHPKAIKEKLREFILSRRVSEMASQISDRTMQMLYQTGSKLWSRGPPFEEALRETLNAEQLQEWNRLKIGLDTWELPEEIRESSEQVPDNILALPDDDERKRQAILHTELYTLINGVIKASAINEIHNYLSNTATNEEKQIIEKISPNLITSIQACYEGNYCMMMVGQAIIKVYNNLAQFKDNYEPIRVKDVYNPNWESVHERDIGGITTTSTTTPSTLTASNPDTGIFTESDEGEYDYFPPEDDEPSTNNNDSNVSSYQTIDDILPPVNPEYAQTESETVASPEPSVFSNSGSVQRRQNLFLSDIMEASDGE